MNYEPVYETVVPKGEYFFKIVKANEGMTKTNKPNLKLTVSIWNDNGDKNTVYWQTLLEFSNNIRKLAKATGELEKYEAKQLEAYHLDNKTGRCEVDIEENALYEKKNIIVSFKPKLANEVAKGEDALLESDLPF